MLEPGGAEDGIRGGAVPAAPPCSPGHNCDGSAELDAANLSLRIMK